MVAEIIGMMMYVGIAVFLLAAFVIILVDVISRMAFAWMEGKLRQWADDPEIIIRGMNMLRQHEQLLREMGINIRFIEEEVSPVREPRSPVNWKREGF